MRNTFLVGVLAMFVSGAGCGSNTPADAGPKGGSGGSGSGNCDKVASCGGDVKGNWKIANVCLEPDQSAIKAICASATLEFTKPMVTGTVSYKADMTYTQVTTLDGSGSATFPMSCLSGITCSALEDPKSTPPTTCAATSDGGCKCTQQSHDTITVTGTYSISGSTLTQIPSMGDKLVGDYCLKGGNLFLQGSFGPLKGQVELAKQ